MQGKLNRTHQQIIDTAITMIREHGFDTVSIDAICSEIGISRSTFYNHFRSKEQLITEYFTTLKAFTPDRIAWVYDAATAYERAVRVQLMYILQSKENERHKLYSTRLKGMLDNPNAYHFANANATRELLIPLIRQAKEAGEILSTESAEALCETAITLNWGNLFMWSISDSSFNRIHAHIQALETLYQVRSDLRGLDRLYNLSFPDFEQQ